MAEDDQVTDAADLAATAEAILTRHFGGAVRLGPGTSPGGGSNRSQVVRFPVAGGPPGAPGSVIVKRARGHDNDPGVRAWRLCNDWAGAELLTRAAGRTPDSAPAFYGGDRAAELFVLEDLGDGPSIADLLLGDDPARAEAALIAFGRSLGHMHGRTAGRFDDYVRLRDALAPGEEHDVRPPLLENVRNAPGKLRGGYDALGVALPSEADAEFDAIAATLADPGPFLAYTHGDPCPDNDRVIVEGDGPNASVHVRLFDWEFGGFRHALLDGVYARVPFPTCWCVNRLPDGLPQRIEQAYRAALVEHVADAADDRTFSRAAAHACAYWTLCTRLGARELLEKDHQWGISTVRQRFVMRLEVLAQTLNALRELPVLADYAARLGPLLHDRWVNEGLELMPVYPAFRTGRERGH